METLYRHRQVGWAMIIIFAVAMAVEAAAIIFLSNMLEQEDASVVMLALSGSFVLLAALLVCFCTLTVTITPEKLTLSFGPGIIRKSVKVSTIVSASSVTNKWWYGLGIHITKYGWLYNVSGLKAVEVHTANGGSMRIGTDEPEALCRAIEQARAMNPTA